MDDFGGGEEDGLIGYRGSEGECGRIADNLKDFSVYRVVRARRESSVSGNHPAAICLPETGFTRTLYLPIIRQRTRSHTLILLKRFRNFRSKRFSGAS